MTHVLIKVDREDAEHAARNWNSNPIGSPTHHRFATACRDALSSNAGTKHVEISDELLRNLAEEWSSPLQIRVDSERDGVLTLVCRRPETFAREVAR